MIAHPWQFRSKRQPYGFRAAVRDANRAAELRAWGAVGFAVLVVCGAVMALWVCSDGLRL